MSDDRVTQPMPSPKDQMLDQQLEDSFPASDPPQMTQPHVHVGGPHRPQADARRAAKAPTRPAKATRR